MSDSKKEERPKWTQEQIKEYHANNYFGNNSFSGADMVAVMHITGVNGINGTYTLGSLQTLSYSTSMQRVPIRSIGNVNAKDYVMGPRTIAGSLVFAVFDKHFAYEAMKAIRGITEEDYHFLADELPPFDITITFANEYGKMAKLAIYGVRLINEGQVMSINDIYTENTYQYVATDIDYLSDQTTNTSGAIYNPLKPNPNSVSNPVVIEDIVIEEPEEDSEDIATYQIVYAKPTDAYVVDGIQYNGKVSLDLFKRVEYGQIVIVNKDTTQEIRYDITEGMYYPLIVENLIAGNYSTYYFSGRSNSKTTHFVINNKRSNVAPPSTPVIVLEEKEPDGTYTIGIQATDSITKGIQYTDNINDSTTWKNIEPVKPHSIIKNLKEYKTYYFRSFNDAEVSSHVACFTDAKKEHLFSDFQTYLENNKYYLTNEWPYITPIMNQAYDQWLITPTFSVATALQNIKSKLDLTDVNRKKAYERLCTIATTYESNHREYVSQSTTIAAPKIVNVGMCQIEFDKRAESLTIKNVENGYPKTVSKNLFQDFNDKYRYVITSKYHGIHEVTVNGPSGMKSPTLSINIPEKQLALELIEEQRASDIILQQQLTAAAIKGLKSQEVLSASEKQKEPVLKEINNNNKVVKQGIGDPSIVYMTESEVNVTCEIPMLGPKLYYLCIAPTDVLGKARLKEKVVINKSSFNHSFYKSKSALIQGKRYSLWIEDSTGKVVSHTTSFNFNSDSTSTVSLKNAEIIESVKDTFTYKFNKDKLNDFKSDLTLSETKLYNSIILYDMNDVPSSDKNKMEYLHDAIMAKHKMNNVSPSLTNINFMRLNTHLKAITGAFKQAGYTLATLVQYDSKGEINTNTYELKHDDLFELTNLALHKFEYGYLYFSNESVSKVSEIILLHYKTRHLKTNLKIEVIW